LELQDDEVFRAGARYRAQRHRAIERHEAAPAAGARFEEETLAAGGILVGACGEEFVGAVRYSRPPLFDFAMVDFLIEDSALLEVLTSVLKPTGQSNCSVQPTPEDGAADAGRSAAGR
jgi:hypothetical protein